MELIYNKTLGCWLRSHTRDMHVPGELNQYKLLSYAGHTVLDLGGHIGCFALYALQRHAEYVVSFEPYYDNCVLYRLNTLEYRQHVNLVEAAVVQCDVVQEHIPFYISNTDTCAHSTVTIRGRVETLVNACTLENALKLSCANVVKLDIEGGEYAIMHDLQELFPSYRISMFAAELHLNLKDWRQRAADFVSCVEKWYQVIKPPVIGNNNWNTVGVWKLRGTS